MLLQNIDVLKYNTIIVSPDRGFLPPLHYVDFHPRDEAAIMQAGILLADHFLAQETPTLLLDMDGVVLAADSLHRPQLTSPHIIPVLKSLEGLGVAVGTATSRSMHVVDFLRDQGLQINGPAILEEGQVIANGGEVEYLVHPNHREFIKAVSRAVSTRPDFVPTWTEARNTNFEEVSFCPGSVQWQGEARSSFWFPYEGSESNDRLLINAKIMPILEAQARIHRLDIKRDIAVITHRMRSSTANGNLGIVVIKGKIDGRPIDKGFAAERLGGSWGFVADGYGDAPLATVTKRKNGLVLGIEGNLDMTGDAPEFLGSADVVLKSPDEFVQALKYSAQVIRRS